MLITRSDPDYLALKAKRNRPIKILASQAVLLFDHIMDRDEEIAELKSKLDRKENCNG